MTPDVEPGVVTEDTSLARRIREGDRGAENAFVQLYSGRVLAMATARTRDREAARELVDDIMMAALVALRSGSVLNTSRLGAFIHGTAVNVINNHLRSRNRRPLTVALDEERFEPGDADCDGHEIDVLMVRRCLAQLSAGDRGVLMLSLVEGLKPGDIAQRTGQSAEVVRQKKSRALARLKQLLNEPSQTTGREPQ